MADTKVSALTDGTTAAATDRIPVARDPTGTPLSRYITPSYIKTYLEGLAQTLTSAAPQLTLGVNATTLGSVKMFGNTSGDVTLRPTAAAGTATVLTMPSTTGTLAILELAQSFTKTQTIALADANVSGLVSTGYSLTGANAQSLIDLAGTWNTSGTPTALKLNITNTASNASSKLIDLQVGGTSQFNVDRTGILTVTGAIRCGTDSSIGSTGAPLAFIINNGSTQCRQSLVFSNGSTQARIANDEGTDGFLGIRNGTTGHNVRVYGTYTSSTDYHRLGIYTTKTTLASVSGATVTATNLIPDGAIVVGVTTKVTVSLGTGGGTTGYQVGDGTDPDRWGQIVGTTAGTSTDNTNWTATTVQAFIAANSVVITADGGNFNGTGSIEVSVQYLIGQCD